MPYTSRPVAATLAAVAAVAFLAGCPPKKAGQTPGTLTGTIAGPSGPISGARVRLVGTTFLRFSDAQGNFTFQNVPSGPATLLATAHSTAKGPVDLYGTVSVTVPSPGGIERGSATVGTVKLAPTGSLSGKITVAGMPSAGMTLAITGQPDWYAHTASDGTFQFPFIPAGPASIVAFNPASDQLPFATVGNASIVSGQAATLDLSTMAVTTPDGGFPQPTLTGQFLFDNSIGPAGDFTQLAGELIPLLGSESTSVATIPLAIDSSGAFQVTADLGWYALHLQPASSVCEVYVGDVPVFPGSTLPPIYVFDSSSGCDTNGNGIPDLSDPDADGDNAANASDGFASAVNPMQGSCWLRPDSSTDTDQDGYCDDIDLDIDNDSLLNPIDNCPLLPNPDQRDSDNDGVGDLCDNCPLVFNPNQADSAGNGIGDACRGQNPCSMSNGGCDSHAMCASMGSHPVCTCDTGYTGDGYTCTDNPCLTNNGNCGANSTCSNNSGVAQCACNSGFVSNGTACVTAGDWQTIASLPPLATTPGIAIAGKNAVLYGGSGGTSVPWVFDLTGESSSPWTALYAVAGPAFDPEPTLFDVDANNILMAITPAGQPTPGIEIWQLTVTPVPAWSQLVGVSPGASPPPETNGSVLSVYDSSNGGRIITVDVSQMMPNAWVLPLTGTGAMTWTMNPTSGSNGTPGGISCASAAYYAATSQVAVFGGGSGCSMSNTIWLLNTTTWQWNFVESSPQAPSPAPRNRQTMIYDPTTPALIVYGGVTTSVSGDTVALNDVWSNSGLASDNWEEMNPSTNDRADHSATFDVSSMAMYVADGQQDGQTVSSLLKLGLGTLSQWGVVYSGPPTLPTPRWEHESMFDPNGDNLFVLGGETPAGVSANMDLWTLSTPATGAPVWSQTTPDPASWPSGRVGHSAVLDPKTGLIIVYGGALTDPNTNPVALGDLWSFTYSSTQEWQLLPQTMGTLQLDGGIDAGPIDEFLSPPPSYGQTAVLDTFNHRMLILGLQDDTQNIWGLPLPPTTPVNWQRLQPTNAANFTLENGYLSAAFDGNPPGTSPRLVVFFGNQTPPGVVFNELVDGFWEWSAPAIVSGTGPSQRSNARVLISDRQLLVQGGIVNNVEVGEADGIWAFDLDAPAWHHLCPVGPTGGARQGSSLTLTNLGPIWFGGANLGFPTDLLTGLPPTCSAAP